VKFGKERRKEKREISVEFPRAVETQKKAVSLEHSGVASCKENGGDTSKFFYFVLKCQSRPCLIHIA
jgi:hypothetical protein